MDLSKIFEQNRAWAQAKLSNDPNYFSEMAKGQAPKILFIGCSDSRVPAEVVMGAEPGEVFVSRNVANMVQNLDMSMRSVIHYAVDHLKVEHIVVCGHYECGGVKAAMGSADFAILNPYLKAIRDVARLHKDKLDSSATEAERYRKLVELNVGEQCLNLMKNEDVQHAMEHSGVQVHGWVYDISKGNLIDLDVMKDMPNLDDIYHVNYAAMS